MFMILQGSTALALAQSGMTTLELKDLSSFDPQAGNWMIVGDVTMDRNISIDHQEIVGEEERKGKAKKPTEQVPGAVRYEEGSGILLNMHTPDKKDQLLTNWEHGDIALELEVMLPKGSNSGIYMQGRYEVQLQDSWGVKYPKFSDMGGIYRNFESVSEKRYMGKAPLVNAAKAPGLWQTLKINFRAPRFDASGKKTANARFERVELNGAVIHDHVEVPLPTGGAIGPEEAAIGPLMIQGDHGPVAFRNIRYRLLRDSNVTLTDLSYKVYLGTFQSEQEFRDRSPDKKGQLEALTWEAAGQNNNFAILFDGTVHIPEDGNYTLRLFRRGTGRLTLNGEDLGSSENPRSIPLTKGSYPVEIVYYKNENWYEPLLGLFVESENTHRKTLHAFNSLPPAVDLIPPIYVDVEGETKLLRAFLDFEGDRKRRLTHTMAVGEPGGSNYIYDLKSGTLVCMWRGGFVEATPMWFGTGDGSFRPVGAVQYFFMEPQLALLDHQRAPFPNKSGEDFRGKGYALDENRKPVFTYLYKGGMVTDKLAPVQGGRMIRRTVTFSSLAAGQHYYKLAGGSRITRLQDGSYAVDDKQYYLRLESETKPFIREVAGKQELVVKVKGQPIQYDIIW
jgi:Domain of Unknown Function (DUF1080)